jgi:hypothetical protein
LVKISHAHIEKWHLPKEMDTLLSPQIRADPDSPSNSVAYLPSEGEYCVKALIHNAQILCERPERLDEILKMLEKATKRAQKALEENRHSASNQIDAYDKVLRCKESSEAQRVRAMLGRTLEYDRLETLSSQLSLLYILQMFTFKVKILQISVENIKEQLAKSGFLEKTKDIEDIKKNFDTLTILLEAQYEAMKQIGENRKDLSYVS